MLYRFAKLSILASTLALAACAAENPDDLGAGFGDGTEEPGDGEGGSTPHDPSDEEDNPNTPPPVPAVCDTGDEESQGCAGGEQTRTCGSDGQWDSWSACATNTPCAEENAGESEEDASDCPESFAKHRSCNENDGSYTWSTWSACEAADNTKWDVIVLRAVVAPLRWDGEDWDTFGNPDVYVEAGASDRATYDEVNTTPNRSNFAPDYGEYKILAGVPAAAFRTSFFLSVWDSDAPFGRDIVMTCPFPFDGADSLAPVDYSGLEIECDPSGTGSPFEGSKLYYKILPAAL